MREKVAVALAAGLLVLAVLGVAAVGWRQNPRAEDYSESLAAAPCPVQGTAPPANQSGRAAFEGYVAHAVETWRHQGPWSGNDRCMTRFADVLRVAADHQMRVIVVMLPVHAPWWRRAAACDSSAPRSFPGRRNRVAPAAGR